MLNINISFHGGCIVCTDSNDKYLADEVETEGPLNTATRRAIVRAAAEIGRKMP
jgi:hypothetical protein